MPDPLSIVSGVTSLAAILAQLTIKVYSLKGILKEFAALASSLETLKDVLDRVEREYTESLKVIDSTSKVGAALKRSIDACFTTCEKIDEVLKKIQNAASRHIRASFEEKTIEGFLRRLERDKSTLKLLMDTITEERQRRQHQGSQGQLVRTESAPPPYAESPALAQTKPAKLVRAQTDIEKIPRNSLQISQWGSSHTRKETEAPLALRQRPQRRFQPRKEIETPWSGSQLSRWSEQPSDDDELDSEKGWQSREDSRDERNDSDEGVVYSTIAGTRSFFGVAYGVED